MKIALITDIHLGARNDNHIFSKYFNDFWENIFFPEIKKRNIDTIICLGDIFDRRKFINYKTLFDAKKMLFEPIENNNIKLHCIIGNHDIYYKNTNDINNMDGLFSKNKNIFSYSEPTEVDFDGTKILFLPWITPENEKDTFDMVKNSKSKIVMGHLELRGFEMYTGSYSEHGYEFNVFNDYDIVMSGHYHHKSEKNNIHYLGATYEYTWADFDDDRGFHIFDTDTMELEYIKNPYKMHYKVYYDDEDKMYEDVCDINFDQLKDKNIKVIVKNKYNPAWFDIFIENITKVNPLKLNIVENFMNDEYDDTDVNESEDTLTILNEYIDSLQLNVEKSSIRDIIKELYVESLDTEYI